MTAPFLPFSKFSESPQAAEAHGQLNERQAIIDRLEAAGLDPTTVSEGCSDDVLAHAADMLESGHQTNFADGDDAALSEDDLGDIDAALRDHGVDDEELSGLSLEQKVDKLIGLLEDSPHEFTEDTDGCDDQPAGGGDPDHIGGGHHDPAVHEMLKGYGISDSKIDRMSESKRSDELLQLVDSDDGTGNNSFSESTDKEIARVGHHFDCHSEQYTRHSLRRDQVLHAYISRRKREPGLTATAFLAGR